MGIYLAWITVSLTLLVQSGVFCKTVHSKKIHHLMTKRELQKYFGVDNHDEVPEYDVTHPYQSTHEGEFVTYDLYSKHRTRREAEADDTHHYSLNSFGKTLNLVLRENKNLIKRGLQVETHTGGKVKKIRLDPSTHYLGEVRGHPESSVAITNHGALSGMIKLRDDAPLFLRPLPRRIAKKVRRNKRSTPHIIYIYDSVGGTSGDPNIFYRDEAVHVKDLKGLHKLVQTKRVNYENDAVPSNFTEKYLELAMVADENVKALHGNNDAYTADYLLTLGNIMNAIFHYDSFGKQKVAIIITKIFITTNAKLGVPANETARAKIQALIRWSNKQYPTGGNATAPPFDAISLVHRGSDLLGVALLSGMCVVRMAPSLSADAGLQTAYKLSHEIGHNMGLGHDGDNACPPGNIMSHTVGGGPEMFEWSNCSKVKVQEYLRGPISSCLDNKPPSGLPTAIAANVNHDKLPGEVNDGDVQCQYQYGASWRRCPQEFGNCKVLFCTKDYNFCHSYSAAPLGGTTCGIRKWCIKGECVDNGSPYINGVWSAWSDTYADCSRTCGGGVQHRTRTCNNPPPQNGGDACEGDEKGHWRICNSKPCPANTPSLRAKQCKAKNSATSPFFISSETCDLRCITDSSELFYYGKVADGTRCNPDERILDVCIKGTCRTVGCDHVLDSSSRLDRCRICNGDGSSCALTTGEYTTNHRGWGVDKAATILTLPPGARDVHIEKRVATTNNLLGIQNAAGSYLISLPTWSKTIKSAGSTIAYKHEADQYKDTLDIDGPTTETLLIKFVYLKGNNGGIDFSYYSPSNVSQTSTYFWNTTGWSSCSRTCAGGYQKRWVYCIRADDKTYVSESTCNSASKPHMRQPCNTQACPAEWHLTQWHYCSKSCGKGSQSRRLYCRRKINSTSHEELPDNSCLAANKPNATEFTRNCREIVCPPYWHPLDWSPCSTTCGPGVTTRNLVCRRIEATGVEKRITSSMCDPVPKPNTSQPCNTDTPCGPSIRNKIACFRANPVPLEQTLADLSGSVDWDHTEITVEKCHNLTHDAGFTYFALGNNGICYSGPNTKTKYYKQGPASLADCDNGIGKQNYMFVYTMVQLPPLTSLGCYKDSNRVSVLPTLYANFRSQINWQNMNLTISKCAHVARDIGRSYFGIRFYGECYTAPDDKAAATYSQQGVASTCWSGVGSNHASFFYTFNNTKV